MRDPAAPFEAKSGSVRSVLHDRNTPGTVQNVRFSRNAYRGLGPGQSMNTEYQSVTTHAVANNTPPKEKLAPTGVDKTIFSAKEPSPGIRSALHGSSNVFSLGEAMFYSMAHGDLKQSSTFSSLAADDPLYPSSAILAKDSVLPSRASSLRIKERNDTLFMSMLRSSSPKPLLRDADINGESSSDLVVCSAAKPEPDPFCANANAHSTPQPNISATHARKAPKEEDFIFSLKTQLALQTELCGKFETHLRVRHELVEVLGKKLSEVEREEAKKRSVLEQWKEKVAELERASRYLEEEAEGSRQGSMERSIPAEASLDALT